MSSSLHHLLDICSASDIPNRLVFCELRSSETRAVVPLFDSAWGPRRNLWKVALPIKRLGRYASGQFLDRQKLPLCKRAVVFQAKADPNRTVWNDVTLAHNSFIFNKKEWCPGWESNPHEEKSPEDFKSSASAIPPPGHGRVNSRLYNRLLQALLSGFA